MPERTVKMEESGSGSQGEHISRLCEASVRKN